jgi:YfiH family protein
MFYSKKLKKFKNLYHCFFSRKNGFSSGLYESLNCGQGSKDLKINIVKNLNYISLKSGVKKNKLILMNQTHSNKVKFVNKKINFSLRIKADALITDLKNVTIGVLTADCVPILLYDDDNKVVGCIHAGWKGSFSGIIENTIKKFNEINSKNKIFASIGPCIGMNNYEVKENFYKIFLNKSKLNKRFFKKIDSKKFKFNLRKYVENKLLDCGVKNIDHINLDTFRDSEHFFSYRRSKILEESDYGRCISTISLKT